MQKMRVYYLDVPRGVASRQLSSAEWRAFCANPRRWLTRAREEEEGYTKTVDPLWISGMAERLARGGWMLSLGRRVYEVQQPIHVQVAGEHDDWYDQGTPTACRFEIMPLIHNGHRSRWVSISLGDAFAERRDDRGRATFDFKTFVLRQG